MFGLVMLCIYDHGPPDVLAPAHEQLGGLGNMVCAQYVMGATESSGGFLGPDEHRYVVHLHLGCVPKLWIDIVGL